MAKRSFGISSSRSSREIRLKLLCRRVTAVGEGLRRFARSLFLLFERLLELLRTVVCILDAIQFLTRFFKICKHLLDA